MKGAVEILRAEIRIAADHPSLPGHFPGRPLVPGVVLLDQVLHAIRQQRACSLRAMPVVKFLQPVLPEERLDLEIHLSRPGPGELRADFRGTRDSVLVLDGTFVLADAVGERHG